MRFSGDYLYRASVTSYPAGSHHEVDYGGELHTEPVPGWQPPGWRPHGDYVRLHGTEEFVWPTTRPVWGSRATALRRVKLLESYGATAVVERSSRITWPETGFKAVPA